MDLDTIKKLIKAMEESQITRVSLKEENGFTLELERNFNFQVSSHVEGGQGSPLPESSQKVISQEKIKEPKEKKEPLPLRELGYYITSPMVGTFYAASSPDDPPLVKVGDVVKEDTVVCIIEAMKVMNEVKAGKSGTVLEVYIENAHPVEFGTELFRIEEQR